MENQVDFRILIIDDNPAIHQDFIKTLTVNRSTETLDQLEAELFNKQTQQVILPNFEISVASQGREGLECIKKAIEEKNPYALAFVDVRMPPGWDGIETIQHIWKEDSDIQIVICTAFSDYSWEETVEKLGMNNNLLVLKKPFDSVAVRQLATALTKKWQLMCDIRAYTKSLESTIKQRTDSLQKSLSLTRATLESSTDGILVVNNMGKVVDYNNQFSEMWGISASTIDAKNEQVLLKHMLSQLKAPNDFLKKVEELHKKHTETSIGTLSFKDNHIYEYYSQPHKLAGAIVGRVWSFRNITDRVYLETQLEHQATHDVLTNLPNRLLLYDRLQQAINTAIRNQTTVAILFIDLDRFKLINDSLSHSIGDKLLVAIAKRLSSMIRKEDTLARIGGDEFIIIIPSLKNKNDAITVATHVLNSFDNSFKISNRDVFITASIGISLYPQNGQNIDDLMRNADLAMYFAKESGTNQFQFYSEEMNKKALVRFEKETELRRAIRSNEFFLCYQPQFDMTNNKIVAVEALVRWRHPKKGVLLPLDFIPVAEETGIIVALGEWILRTACAQNKIWQEEHLLPIRMAVNITTQQLKQPNFVAMVKDILQETGLQPELLELEITENVIVTSFRITEVIKELKEIGVQIALDDFGTGNSTLNYLRKIPIDRLKIDKSFIQNIDLNRSDAVIVQAIVTMAHNLNLEVLAEGVETSEQMKFLKKQDCTNIQGFYASEPLNAQACKKLLNKLNKCSKKS